MSTPTAIYHPDGSVQVWHREDGASYPDGWFPSPAEAAKVKEAPPAIEAAPDADEAPRAMPDDDPRHHLRRKR
jgi:hypothetical protein